MSERKPIEVYPLASFLAEEMIARGWNTAALAAQMHPEPTVKDVAVLDMLLCVHKDGLIIDDEMFRGLALAFGISEQYFRNLHEKWLNWPDRREAFDPPEHILSGAPFWHETPESKQGID